MLVTALEDAVRGKVRDEALQKAKPRWAKRPKKRENNLTAEAHTLGRDPPEVVGYRCQVIWAAARRWLAFQFINGAVHGGEYRELGRGAIESGPYYQWTAPKLDHACGVRDCRGEECAPQKSRVWAPTV